MEPRKGLAGKKKMYFARSHRPVYFQVSLAAWKPQKLRARTQGPEKYKYI